MIGEISSPRVRSDCIELIFYFNLRRGTALLWKGGLWNTVVFIAEQALNKVEEHIALESWILAIVLRVGIFILSCDKWVSVASVITHCLIIAIEIEILKSIAIWSGTLTLFSILLLDWVLWSHCWQSNCSHPWMAMMHVRLGPAYLLKRTRRITKTSTREQERIGKKALVLLNERNVSSSQMTESTKVCRKTRGPAKQRFLKCNEVAFEKFWRHLKAKEASWWNFHLMQVEEIPQTNPEKINSIFVLILNGKFLSILVYSSPIDLHMPRVLTSCHNQIRVQSL